MNNPELFFSNSECEIFYNTELKAVQTKWKGIYVSGEPFRKILDAIIELLSLKKSSIVIADAREMKIIGGDDQKWIINSWYPRALAAGFRFEALVVTRNTFNELTVKKIVRSYDEKKLKTEYFITLEDAYGWVKDLNVN